MTRKRVLTASSNGMKVRVTVEISTEYLILGEASLAIRHAASEAMQIFPRLKFATLTLADVRIKP